MDDLISRQAAIEAMSESLKRVFPEHRQIAEKCLNVLPSAQEKPFNLPEIYIAEGYDTIEGEDGNVGFGVYVPDETKIYVAGDVEGEIRARALFHEVCHWVQAMCGRPFDEDEANEFSDIVYDALPSAQPEILACGEGELNVPDTNVGDMISRQAAIDALDVLCQEHRYKIPGKRETYSQYNEAWQDALDRAEGAIFNLPTVQPDHTADVSKKAEGDCISRQAAIECVSYDVEHTIKCLKNLPSIQKSYTKADYIMCLHKQYGCDLIKAEKAHEKALQYLRDNTLVRG